MNAEMYDSSMGYQRIRDVYPFLRNTKSVAFTLLPQEIATEVRLMNGDEVVFVWIGTFM